jgi:AcrR family transcriptional regulator
MMQTKTASIEALKSPQVLREELLDLAFQLITKSRFCENVVERLASAARVSPSIIFRHFRTRADLGDALGKRYIAILKSQLGSLPQTGSAISDLRLLFVSLCDAYWRSSQQSPGLLDVLVITLERDGHTARSFHEFLQRSVFGIVQNGKRSGEIRVKHAAGDTTMVFNSLMAVANPYSFWRYGHGLQSDVIREQIDVVLRRLLNENRAAAALDLRAHPESKLSHTDFGRLLPDN